MGRPCTGEPERTTAGAEPRPFASFSLRVARRGFGRAASSGLRTMPATPADPTRRQHAMNPHPDCPLTLHRAPGCQPCAAPAQGIGAGGPSPKQARATRLQPPAMPPRATGQAPALERGLRREGFPAAQTLTPSDAAPDSGRSRPDNPIARGWNQEP